MNALADRDFCAALVISLGHFLWQGMLIAGLVAIAVRRLKSARARYNVLAAAFCLMAVSPFATLAIRNLVVENSPPLAATNEMPVDAAPLIADASQPSGQSNGSLVPIEVSHVEQHAGPPAATPIPTAPPITSSADNGWQRFAPLMMNVYLLGVAAMLLRLVVGVWGGWRLRHRSTPVEEVALLQALRRQAQSLGMKCVPVLAWCESVAVPTVIGILKPTILLPLSLTSGLAADQVESVLAHELAHLRRYDHLVNLFQRVVESLLFFHPAVWWLSNRIRVEREHCCDDMVVACGAVPLDYAKSLLRVAELSRLSRRNRSVSAVSLLATGQPSTLRQRIARLLGDATDTHVRFLHRWPAILLATICLLVAWTTTRVGWGLPPRSDEKPAPFVAELPGGVKVELLSIGYHQTLMKKWWAADGTVLPAEPRDPKLKRVEFSSFTGGSLQGEAREVAVRITGIPKQETFVGYQFCWEPYGDAVSNAVVYEPSEFTSASMPLVSQLKDKKVSLRICIDPLPEEIVRTISADGTKKLGGDPMSEVLRRVDALMQPVRVEKVGDQTELLLKPVNRGAGPPINEWVPVAIDKVGGRHESIRSGGREGFFTYRYPVALSEIARFEYRLKPYRHWVTFSNLSVHPGEKTDVQVKVESLVPPTPVAFTTPEDLPPGAIQRMGSGRYRVPALRGVLDYSADGRLVLAQADQSMIVVKPEQRLTALDRETGRAVKDPRFELGDGFVQGMAFSEDARLVAVVMRDLPFNREEPNDRIVVIDTESNRRQVLPWKRRPGDVRALCISRDKKTLAAGTERDGLTLWNLESGERIEKPSWPETRLTSVAFSPDGSTLAVIGQQKSLLWKWRTDGAPRELTREASDRPLVVRYTPNGKWFVVGCNAVNNVRVFDAITGDFAWSTDSQQKWDQSTDLAIDDNSHLLAVPKWHSNAVELWDLNTRKIVHTFKCLTPRSVAFSRDGKWVVAGGENSVHEWNLATHEPRTVGSESHSTRINKIRFAPDGRSLLTASDEGTIWQWDLATGKPNLKLDHETGRRVRGLAVSPDGRIIVSSGLDDSVAVWDRATGKELLTLAGHGEIGGCRPVVFAADGQRFATWGDDMRLCWWNTSDGKLLSTVSTQPPDTPKAGESINGGPEEFPTGVFSSDASTLLMEYLGRLYEIDTATGLQRRQIRTDSGVRYFALSPDGKWLATVERQTDLPVDGRPSIPVILRNRDTLEIQHQFKIPTQFVEGIEFSPDSQHLAFAPAAQPTTIINVQSGLIAAQIPNDSSCTSLRFSPNGKSLATSHVDTTVVLWDWEKFRTNAAVGVVDDLASNTAVVATDGRATDKKTSKPDSQSPYQTATYLQEKISAKIPDAAWGKPNKGLRLAMVIRDESKTDWNELPAGTRVPASWALRQGDQIHSQLVVENVSDKPINLTGYTYTEVERSIAVFDREQKELSMNATHIDILPVPTSWKLLPGERYLLQMPPIAFLDAQSEHRGIGYYVRTPPGEYTVRCGYAFGQRGKDDPRPAPDPSEWTGVLQAGDIKVTVDDPNDKTASRVRRGQDALDRIEQFKPAWGELRSGIQMGLARLGETDKFRPGQRIPLEFYLRNVGKQTAKVRFHVEFYSEVPTVRDADGKEVKVELVHLLGARARFTETLKPGEAVAWPHWGLGIGADRPAGYSSIWHPYIGNPAAGTYTVSQDLDSHIEVEGSSEAGGGLTSGRVKFEIVTDSVAAAATTGSNPLAGPESVTNRADSSAATSTGTLVAPDGKPVPGIEILVYEGRNLLDEKRTTNEQGQFTVPRAWADADRRVIVVARDGTQRLGWFDFFYNEHSDNGQKASEGSFKMVLLPLDRTVRGRIIDPAGKPLPNVPVQIEFLQHAVNFSSTSWHGRMLTGAPLLQPARTNDQGEFELKVPADAGGTLRTSSFDWVEQRISFRRNQNVLGDVSAVRAARIAGQVLDSRTGKPRAGIGVGAQVIKADIRHGGWGDAVTNADGRYEIGGLPEGEYNILLLEGAEKTLAAAAHASAALKSGETFQADFRLVVGQRLTGRVVDEKTGQPIADCQVGYYGTARPPSGGANLSTSTNARGEFEFFVPPGKSGVYVADARETGVESSRDVDVVADRESPPVTLKAGPKSQPERIKIWVGAAAERMVSLKADRMPLEQVLTKLAEQANVTLALDSNGLKTLGYTRNMPVKVDLQNIALQEALQQVLMPFEKLSFVVDESVLFVSTEDKVQEQIDRSKWPTGMISGVLLNGETGQPVMGATVICQMVAGEEGKAPAAAETDRDGKYILKDVPVGIYNVWLYRYDADPKLVAAADQGVEVQAGQTAASKLRLVVARQVRGQLIRQGKPVAAEQIGCYSAARPQSTANVQSTKSAADGTFEFLLPPGPAYFYTMSGGFTAEKRLHASTHLMISPNGDVPIVTLEMSDKETKFGSPDWVANTTKGSEVVKQTTNASVTGVVVDPQGNPIPRAVLIKAENWDERIWTDDKGEFNLKVDRGTQFVFAVHAPGYNVWSGTPTTGDVLKIVLEPKVSSKDAANPGKQPDETETKSDAQKGVGQDAVPQFAAGAEANKSFERVKPSVVVVTTRKLDDEGQVVNGLTIGLIVDERGYILANGLILQKVDPHATRVKLHNGATYLADLMAVDLSTGMALLRINAKETLTRSPLGSSADLKEGDAVLGASTVFAPKSAEVKSLVVAKGTIGGLHQDLVLGRKVDYTNLIQADIDTTPGGGPLWNAAGKLVGFTVVMRIGDRKQAFAKEIDSILPFLKKEIPPVP